MSKGFTLIELIIYSAIICLLLVGSSIFAWQIIQGNIKISTYREVEQNINFAMEKITFAIRNSSKIVQPNTPGESSSLLELNMQDPFKTPTRIEVSNQKLIIKEGGNGPYSLTSDLVKVTNLKFTNLSYKDTSGILKIELVIESESLAKKREYEAKVNLENSVSLRY